MNKSIRPEIKKDARDIILDFIRSRPPLKNSSRRSLKPKIVRSDEPVNLHEQLMLSIRNYSTPLRKISIDNSNYLWKEICFQIKIHLFLFSLSLSQEIQSSDDKQNKPESTTKHQKRLLKADKKLLNNLTSSDDVINLTLFFLIFRLLLQFSNESESHLSLIERFILDFLKCLS